MRDVAVHVARATDRYTDFLGGAPSPATAVEQTGYVLPGHLRRP